jgi:hypothetical protein
MGSGAMIYILSFVKISLGTEKLMVGEVFTDTPHGDRISLILFFQINESRLKIKLSLYLIKYHALEAC